MLTPATYGAMLLTLVLSALFWGTWANTLRADRKWRFEFYAVDFALGALSISLLLAMTIGNSGSGNSFTFEDNLTVAGKRNMGIAVLGGLVYCLGNLMILAGVTLAGMSTALPAAAAMGLLTAVAAAAVAGAPASAFLVYGGAGVALAAAIAAALAQKEAAIAAPVKRGMHPGLKGLILSTLGGLIAGVAWPIVESSKAGDIGLGAHAAAVFMTLGILAMTPLVDLYFLNLPVQGEAASASGYLKGTKRQHLLGLAGGALWAAGTTLFLSSSGGAITGAPKFLGIEALAYSGAVLGALCGLTIWSEQAEAPKARLLLLATMGLLAAAAAAIFLGA